MTAPRSFNALALISELLTSVRVETTVQRMGGNIRVVETETDFLADLDREAPAIAILDLNAGPVDLSEIAGACSRLGVSLVAFGRHSDARVLRAARQAGVALVVPRGKFLEDARGVFGGIIAWDTVAP